MTFYAIASGDLAYLDTFSGLVPCKVMSISDDRAIVRVTADRRAYRKGEAINASADHLYPNGVRIVARSQVTRRGYAFRIHGSTVLVPDTKGGI